MLGRPASLLHSASNVSQPSTTFMQRGCAWSLPRRPRSWFRQRRARDSATPQDRKRKCRRPPRGPVAVVEVFVVREGVYRKDDETGFVDVRAHAREVNVGPGDNACISQEPRCVRIVRVSVIPPASRRLPSETLDGGTGGRDRPSLPRGIAMRRPLTRASGRYSHLGVNASQPCPPISTLSIEISGSASAARRAGHAR
jgi:hypothetical protein